ncbi:hypothetical protein GWK47_040128 [Chionoecetes opilio]|uniref:Uncharacterized protein n=1 Tax=Chionoecetes opilio TaxID=41210 RepID=A0A8J4YJY7_CHIOP|nr:hypothetical protein GWK47_040128 [Chionoecetes opilio]
MLLVCFSSPPPVCTPGAEPAMVSRRRSLLPPPSPAARGHGAFPPAEGPKGPSHRSDTLPLGCIFRASSLLRAASGEGSLLIRAGSPSSPPLDPRSMSSGGETPPWERAVPCCCDRGAQHPQRYRERGRPPFTRGEGEVPAAGRRKGPDSITPGWAPG